MSRVVFHVKNVIGFTLVWIFGKIAHRVVFKKSSAIPRSGPAIIVVNHLSTTETLAVAKFVISHRRFPHFLSMEEVFSWPIIGLFMRASGQIPVKRGTASAADSLSAASEKLEKGQVVVVYPEGRLTREADLRPGRAKTGAARLALEHPEVVLIPVGQWGALPGRRHMLHRHTATLSVGEPIIFSAEAKEDPAVATNEIMTAILRQVEISRGKKFDE